MSTWVFTKHLWWVNSVSSNIIRLEVQNKKYKLSAMGIESKVKKGDYDRYADGSGQYFVVPKLRSASWICYTSNKNRKEMTLAKL